jgi:secretion/DNA translocation related TadE-like protein
MTGPMTGPMTGSVRERGSAAVLAAIVFAILATVTVAVGAVGGLLADQRRVESAADLAALAGAAAMRRGEDGCGAAAVVARANQATLVGCSQQGDALTVRTVRPVRTVLGRTLRLHAEARAGPATGALMGRGGR